jgi:hypothetical protein
MAVSNVRELYSSSNCDRWEVGRDELGRLVIIHTPNLSSGGKPKLMTAGTSSRQTTTVLNTGSLVSIILQEPWS